MKIKYYYILFITLTLFSLFGCFNTSLPKNNEEIKTPPEKIVNESKTVQENNDEPDVNEEEYLRSINNLNQNESVSKSEFNEDKKAILKIIDELSTIMATENVDDWLKYIEPVSIDYYTNPVNLQKAQNKLPNKSIKLKSINDYFKYVFIPSRRRSKVDEIRYISKTSIKAVQVKDDKSIVVYYYFTKVGDKWLVHLPTVS